MDPNTRALMMGAAGGGPVGPATYVEDVFQTWLHTGNNSTLSVANGIDLSTKGGMVWLKSRSAIGNNFVCDTARGVSKLLLTNTNDPNDNVPSTSNGFASFDTNGFTLAANYSGTNVSGTTYTSWTFRKQAKFFDVVTWVGNGSNQTISHSLGSVPGVIIAKRTDTAGDWYVYHRSLTTASQNFLVLNSTAAANGSVGADIWAPTSTTFKASTTLALSNSSATYVAYLFAHDAGGFGASGNDSIIKCGSFTATGSDVTVDLGWEPQWLLVRSASNADPWYIYDSMRGLTANNSGTTGVYLQANSSNAETTSASNAYIPQPTSTGFIAGNSLGWGSGTMIYIAIRRGPMKTPTDATKVFEAVSRTATSGSSNVFTTALPVVDVAWNRNRPSVSSTIASARLTGSRYLVPNSAAAEVGATSTDIAYDYNYKINPYFWIPGESEVNWLFRRAPGFFDVVAYTGTGVASDIPHSLGVTPELVFWKARSTTYNWYAGGPVLGTGSNGYYNILLSGTGSRQDNGYLLTSMTSTIFKTSTTAVVNGSGTTFIAYLFASCPGVSKVGSYTGTGTTLNIDCGFTNGARFVLIKRTDTAGYDWYVWDTARGIIAANDPYLLLNSNAAEVTGTDYIDPLSSGFQISSAAPAAINANGGSYIYLSVA